VLVVEPESDRLHLRLRPAFEVGMEVESAPDAGLASGLDEQSLDFIDALAEDLACKAREAGATALIESLEDSLSGFLRIGDRSRVECLLGPRRETDRLFELHVDSRIGRFSTHLPFYELRAAATRFGDSFANADSADTDPTDAGRWIRLPDGLRADPDMFVARVVGRSMEPRIPDGSLCVFRHGVAGSRQGRLLLVELFDETNFASRYTVKRYTSVKKPSSNSAARRPAAGDDRDSDFAPEPEWSHASIRLEPLNREFEAFELSPDRFRVVAEFVAVLED
jgi:hypothetical protein